MLAESKPKGDAARGLLHALRDEEDGTRERETASKKGEGRSALQAPPGGAQPRGFTLPEQLRCEVRTREVD
jgi:hypothetical protein